MNLRDALEHDATLAQFNPKARWNGRTFDEPAGRVLQHNPESDTLTVVTESALMSHQAQFVNHHMKKTAHDKKTCMSKDGQYQYLGAVPLDVYARHPELAHDDQALLGFLNRHPEYRGPRNPV